MNVVAWLVAIGIVAGLYFFLKRRNHQYGKLSGGFANYYGISLSEKQLLCVVVLEELQRCKDEGRVLVAKKTRIKRIVLTSIFIILNLALLTQYYRPGAAMVSGMVALAYTFIYYRFDPVSEVCAAVKKQPDRDISEIVSGMTATKAPKSLKPVGIIAFALTIILFFFIYSTDHYIFTEVDGGYRIDQFSPGIFRNENKIPETHEGRPVVEIGENAFEEVPTLKKVTIPKTVVRIDAYAFKGCSNLEEIELPAGLQTLNGESFKNCVSLREIKIPAGVTEIRGNTFEGCTSLEQVELHDHIIDIHAYAFRGCEKLKQIDLPSGITEIHAYTFENCKSLERIEIPVGVTRIAAHAFYGCRALNYVYVPDTVTEIRSSAFRACTSLDQIALPDGVTVDERAFKESPTKQYKKDITDAQWEEIRRESWEKESDKLFYVYKKDTPDEIVGENNEAVRLTDDAKYQEKLKDTEAMAELKDDSELLAYLEKAKAAGFTKIRYHIYSPKGSEFTGKSYFLVRTIPVVDMIDSITEGNNG